MCLVTSWRPVVRSVHCIREKSGGGKKTRRLRARQVKNELRTDGHETGLAHRRVWFCTCYAVGKRGEKEEEGAKEAKAGPFAERNSVGDACK